MKQIFIKFSMLAAVAMLITACSKDNNEDNTSEPVTSIKFNMSEAPYNDDVEMAGSRSAVTEIIKETFEMGGIEAEVPLERDSEQPKNLPTTRAQFRGRPTKKTMKNSVSEYFRNSYFN